MNYLWLYLAVMVVLWWLYLRRQRRIQRENAQQLQQSLEAGLAEPASLHPVIDTQRCIGSSSCVKACPEDALGIVNGKAVLINGASCIGHGACRAACPVEAIDLVFGTEKRGIDIPQVSPTFESNVPGIFIAGELGGMGLIRKAAEQGRQAIDAIRARPRGDFEYDVVVVGCGPAGLSAGLAAISAQAEVPSDRAGDVARRRGLPLSAQQDRDDCAGETGADRKGALRRDSEGKTARLLERRGQEDRPEDLLSRMHGGRRARR